MPPTRSLVLIMVPVLLLWLPAIRLATSTPWVGLDRVAASQAVAAEASRRLISIVNADGSEFRPEPGDFIEEPDYLDQYEGMARFFERQSALSTLLRSPVTLHWESPQGPTAEQVIPGARPLRSLPTSFWYQLVVGSIAVFLGCWVWLLRRGEFATRLFAFTGLSFLLISWPSAIYSSRGLALEGGLFRALATLNHLGVTLFGCGLVALMMAYPRLRFRARWLLAPFAVFLPWFLADALRLAPDQNWGSRLPVLLQMTAALGLGVWQWWQARGDLLGRTALRWVLLSTLVGCGLFVFPMVGAQLLGKAPPLPQGYALGFFLFMFGGLALAVGRYRLFDLDRYAYIVLLWTAGAMLVLLLDALLVLGLDLSPEPALALALLVSGWGYFPLRQWLWMRMLHPTRSLLESMEDVIALGMDPSPARQAQRWQALLANHFGPARCEEWTSLPAPTLCSLLDEGLALAVPAEAGSPALKLSLKNGGRTLFGPEDVRFVRSLGRLVRQLLERQNAAQAAALRERQRLADDLHDDLGSRLLMLIHRARGTPLAEIAREAMADLRSLVAALDGPDCSLQEALANSRAEAGERCEAANVPLSWRVEGVLPEFNLGSRNRSLLERCLRELVTNALKHGDGTGLDCMASAGQDLVCIRLRNGLSLEVPLGKPGRGTKSLQRRLGQVGGSLTLVRLDDASVEARVEFPACAKS